MTANRTVTLALLLALLAPAIAPANDAKKPAAPAPKPEALRGQSRRPPPQKPRAQKPATGAPLARPAKPEAPLTKLEVSPPAISLNNARDRQSIVVQATYADGITRDVTAKATLTPANPALLRRDKSTFWPASDGKTTLTVAFGGQKVDVPVEVKGAKDDPALSFRLDVMPVFMRSGCNTGSCHGAARGKDGFRISLFGFDPAGDHYRLTHEISGRRVNLAVPADSTLLEKSIGAVQHTGGKRFEKDSELYKTIYRWIDSGVANDDVTKLPKVVAVELYPKTAVLDGEKSTQQMTLLAKYSDGTDRDVTGLAVFLTNNDTSAAVSPDGLVTAGARGEAFVMARFETYTVGSQFIVLPKALQFEYPKEPEGNYVDKLVAAKLQKLRISPSAICTDEVFIRRVSLDIVGIPPTVEEYNHFMASAAPDKRAKLIDELLGRKEFAEIWVNKWAELLQIKSSIQISYKAMFLYYNWLVERLGKDMPMDQMVQELLGATGGTFKNPATNFYQNTTEILRSTENVAQVFMGMRIQCAQCHNHPFDRWTQDDYYGFAAFFSQIGRKQGEDYRETIVFNSGGGEMAHPVGGRAMKPKFLGGAVPDTAGKDRRVILAKWLASKDNPWFASSFANRVWAHFTGAGIVEPVDDFRVSNPASNAELLEELGKRFTASNYNLKALVRDICNSRTYQPLDRRRNDSNMTDERNFAHALLPADQGREPARHDELRHRGRRTSSRGLPLGTRRVQIADGTTSTYFLTTFGRATRETPCSCEVKMEPTLSQALHLLNGSTSNDKIKQGGIAKRMIDSKKPPEELITELYLRCLTRKPTKDELDKLHSADDRRGVEQAAGRCEGHLLGPAQQPRVPFQPLIRRVRPMRPPSFGKQKPSSPDGGMGRAYEPYDTPIPRRGSPVHATPIRPPRPARLHGRPRGRREGQAEGHVRDRLGDLPGQVQQLPQRRQGQGGPEPRHLRRGDAGRIVRLRDRGGRRRRVAAL